MIKYALLAAILAVSVFGLWLQDANMKALSAEITALQTSASKVEAQTVQTAAQVRQADSALDVVRRQLADVLRPKDAKATKK